MKRIALAVGILVVVTAAAVIATRASPGPHHANAQSASTTTAGWPGSSSSVTTLTANDLVGARDAAVVAVGLTDEAVSAGFISRRDLIARFATPSFAPLLAERTGEQVNGLLAELGKRDTDLSRVRLLERPFTATARLADGGVRVEVWSVLVIAAPGFGPARQVWHTVTLQMARTDGHWLVDGWESRSGPTPGLAPEARLDAAEVVAERLDGGRLTGGGV